MGCRSQDPDPDASECATERAGSIYVSEIRKDPESTKPSSAKGRSEMRGMQQEVEGAQRGGAHDIHGQKGPSRGSLRPIPAIARVTDAASLPYSRRFPPRRCQDHELDAVLSGEMPCRGRGRQGGLRTQVPAPERPGTRRTVRIPCPRWHGTAPLCLPDGAPGCRWNIFRQQRQRTPVGLPPTRSHWTCLVIQPRELHRASQLRRW